MRRSACNVFRALRHHRASKSVIPSSKLTSIANANATSYQNFNMHLPTLVASVLGYFLGCYASCPGQPPCPSTEKYQACCISPPIVSVGRELGSLTGQQLHIDGERRQVADAANLCTKELRKQAKAIWDAKNTLDDQVNDLVMAYRKHDLDAKRANYDQAAAYCKSLHYEFKMLTMESKEMGIKMQELEKSEIGRKSAKLLAKMRGK
jgi:hypothetical protein